MNISSTSLFFILEESSSFGCVHFDKINLTMDQSATNESDWSLIELTYIVKLAE